MSIVLPNIQALLAQGHLAMGQCFSFFLFLVGLVSVCVHLGIIVILADLSSVALNGYRCLEVLSYFSLVCWAYAGFSLGLSLVYVFQSLDSNPHEIQ